jgi:hypothetical protein
VEMDYVTFVVRARYHDNWVAVEARFDPFAFVLPRPYS